MDASANHQFAGTRLLLLLTVAVALPMLELAAKGLVAASILVAYWASSAPLKEWWGSLWRFKWLLLSIVIACLWVTPGEPLYRNEVISLPSELAFLLAAERLLLLIALIGLVRLCLYQIEPTKLVAGLQRLATPLTWFGVNTDKGAVRAALALEYLHQSSRPSYLATSKANSFSAKLNQLAEGFAEHWFDIENRKPCVLSEQSVQTESALLIMMASLSATVLLIASALIAKIVIG